MWDFIVLNTFLSSVRRISLIVLRKDTYIYASQNNFGFCLNYTMCELGRLSSWVQWIYDNITAGAPIVGFGLTVIGAL